MGKNLAIGTVAVYVAWQIIDIVVHGMLLAPSYAATAQLWRPEAEMKSILMVVVTIIAAGTFTYIYTALVGNKSMATAVKYGVVFGIGAGVSMGYGTYAVQPITYGIALSWFLTVVVEGAIGGAILGMLVKK